MSFVYPHTICITRPNGETDVGAVRYGGVSPRKETLIASDISASIQMRSGGSRPSADLPADAAQRTFWKILIPLEALAEGVIKTRDICTDKRGQRYQVISPYWTALGYNLLVERLEV